VKNNWSEKEVIRPFIIENDLKEKIKIADYEAIRVNQRDNRLLQYLNDLFISTIRDNNEINRKSKELLHIQVHLEPPSKVAYRNLILSSL
jgi:hypothetical protein